MLLAPLDLTVIPSVPAAIEETIALGAQAQEEALAVEVAVAGADDKNDLDREDNEQHFLKNLYDRFHNRHFWICRIACSVRKKIRYQRELGI